MPLGIYPRKKRSIEERFWPYVEKTETCWLWTGCKQSKGYGLIGAGGRGGAALLVHRVGYMLAGRTIPEGMELDHLCKVRHCVNPDHLEPVPHRLNVQRGNHSGPNQRNKRKTHCPQGHKYSPENTYVQANGWRKCVACDHAHKQRQRELYPGPGVRGPDKKPRKRRPTKAVLP